MKMELRGGGLLGGLKSTPQRGSAELSGVQLPLARGQTPCPPSNTALVVGKVKVKYAQFYTIYIANLTCIDV